MSIKQAAVTCRYKTSLLCFTCIFSPLLLDEVFLCFGSNLDVLINLFLCLFFFSLFGSNLDVFINLFLCLLFFSLFGVFLCFGSNLDVLINLFLCLFFFSLFGVFSLLGVLSILYFKVVVWTFF